MGLLDRCIYAVSIALGLATLVTFLEPTEASESLDDTSAKEEG